jgi:predicted transcriptional regulator of viral defense system
MKQIEYIQELISHGRWTFTTSEIAERMDKDFYGKIYQLRRTGRVINPARGFYVIVPEEYIGTERLPVERYINAMMDHLSLRYYVGLLTASSFYGASHQSPQKFQVLVSKKRRNITVKRNQIIFYQKKMENTIPINQRKTSTGYFNISTPEATLFDLVEFYRQVGGLEQVGLIAIELSERLTAKALLETAQFYPIPIIQRAGYLLEIIGQNDLANILRGHIQYRNPVYTFLNPSGNRERINKHTHWKLFINQEMEFDL